MEGLVFIILYVLYTMNAYTTLYSCELNPIINNIINHKLKSKNKNLNGKYSEQLNFQMIVLQNTMNHLTAQEKYSG